MRDWQLGLAIILLSACAEQVQSQLTVVPPAPIALPASAAAADGDADGVSDAADKCPGEKEDGEAPLPADGCAATDDDGDGVRVGDRCPQEKETPNGYQDEDGCPDEAPLAQFDGDQVKLRQRIAFGGFGLLSKESDPVLDAIAKLITEASDIGLVEVSGHLSGGRSMNRSASSKSRAQTVVDALTKRGIAKTRLEAAGYGDKCMKGVKPSGRESVRIELTVRQRGGSDTGSKGGCP